MGVGLLRQAVLRADSQMSGAKVLLKKRVQQNDTILEIKLNMAGGAIGKYEHLLINLMKVTLKRSIHSDLMLSAAISPLSSKAWCFY